MRLPCHLAVNALPQACGSSTTAVRQRYHRPVVALPLGSGKATDEQ